MTNFTKRCTFRATKNYDAMKNFVLLSLLCAVLLACEKETPQFATNKEGTGTVVFGTPVKSGYDATDESINGWLIIEGITYTSQCSYFEAYEPVMIKELAFMDMDSWISCICVRAKEAVEVLEERVDGDVVYRKYKMRCPVLYNDFSFDLFYIEERAFASIDDANHMFPSPNIESSLAYNNETKQPDMVWGGKTYKCYLVEVGINLTCAEKTILCEASFLALDEK